MRTSLVLRCLALALAATAIDPARAEAPAKPVPVPIAPTPNGTPRFAGPEPETPRDIRIPTVDLSTQTKRHAIIARGTRAVYQGHCDTVLLRDGHTMFAAWCINHAGHLGPLARSEDGGLTWSDPLPVPENWTGVVHTTPTVHRLTDPRGVERLFVFGGCDFPGHLQQAISTDNGKTWSPMQPIGLAGECAPKSILPVEGGRKLMMWSDRRDPANAKDPAPVVWQSVSEDGGLTWQTERVVLVLPGQWGQPCVVRSPDGQRLLMLLRENTRQFNGLFSVSDDEGRTWAAPRELPAALTGDRPVIKASTDGRLVVAFRDMAKTSATYGHYVAWVGTFDDIVNRREGAYRIKLLHNAQRTPTDQPGAGNTDCGYSDLELLPDGTFVATTYIKYAAGPEQNSVVSTRFKLEETDVFAADLMRKQAKPAPVQDASNAGSKVPFISGGLTIPSTSKTNNRGTITQQTVPGVTHIEAYLFWRHLEPEKNRWELAEFDEMLGLCEPRGLKMLVLPWVMYAPDWFKKTADYQPVVNIQNGLATDMLSPWAPGTDAAFDHFYAALAQRYGKQISIIKYSHPGSDFGEVGLWIGGSSMLPGGGFYESVPQDPANWMKGWWCGDRWARADFREQMLKKHGDLAKLNAAWGTQFATEEAIDFPDPDHREGMRVRWIDFIGWIQDSQVRNMTRLLRIIRKHFPDTWLDIPMGFGSDLASDGCDRTAICRAAAEFPPVNVRSTHGSVNRGALPRAYWFYKRMAPVCLDAGISFGTEPPGGDVTTPELKRQIFEDASAGASFIFHYFQNYHRLPDVIGEYKRVLRPQEHPLVDIGVLYPTTQMMLDLIGHPEGQIEFCAKVRKFLDYDLVDENMIAWDKLPHYRVLLHTSGRVFRTDTLRRIDSWLQGGGVLITRGQPQWENETGDPAIANAWLAQPTQAPPDAVLEYPIGKGRIYAVPDTKIPGYMLRVLELLTARARQRPLHGFDGKDDSLLTTEFPSGRLVFDEQTLETTFLPSQLTP